MNRIATIGMAVVVAGSLAMGCQTFTGKTAGRNVDDAGITSTVKSRLVSEKFVNLTRVDVDTNNGVVMLSGVVESEDAKRRAEQIAREAGEVKDVVNNLQVKAEMESQPSAGSPSGSEMDPGTDGSAGAPAP